MSFPEKDVRGLLSQLVISLPVENIQKNGLSSDFNDPVELLLQGHYAAVLQMYSEHLFDAQAKSALEGYPATDLLTVLQSYVDAVDSSFTRKFENELVARFHLHLVAIALLQTFIQINFTGPAIEHNSREDFFPNVDADRLQRDAIDILNISGQQTYELMEGALYFILSELIFERLTRAGCSVLEEDLKTDVIIDFYSKNNGCTGESTSDSPALQASIQWWMARALQVHISLLFEPASILSSVSSLLLNPSVANALSPSIDGNAELQKSVQIIYYLECARTGIHNQTEHLSVPLLGKARKLSNFHFILSGAKAKRTKFQKHHTSALIVLAKSQDSKLFTSASAEQDTGKENPESFALDSDLLLEKPQFESLQDLEFKEEESDKKRLKLDDFSGDSSSNAEDDEEKLLPIAFRTENIPEELRSLDPNDQPGLSDLDNLQLLLRLTTLRQTSPTGNAMVDEELVALVSRVLYTSSKQTNWTIFSRALWERSILETTKARTVERGILQMTSLVEELGIKIKTRMIPQAMEDDSATNDSSGSLPASFRLRFIHQLPLLPQWSMDAKLAEKFMSLGVLRSAVEIYLRLNMVCEAALCYAAVGEENEAEKLLVERLEANPKDARAISILGDIRQDPSLWQKAWDVGKYYKAQGSLSHYYYSPPKASGLTPNIELAIKHMNICLTSNPLNYENWFFYGCCGLESEQYNLASEAFTRCVSLDENNSHAWSNLASALLRTDKTRPAFNALKKAIRSLGDNKLSWRIYENYLIVAAKLNEWSDVLIACRELINLRRDDSGEGSVDIPVVEKLVEILVATEYPSGDDDSKKLTFYQSSCIEFVCVLLPNVINTSARLWRIVARVELWRRRPWVALECHEKAYRAVSHRPELEFDEAAWNDAVEACSDLIAAYESLGELPGKHDAGDVVCKDWKYKSRSTVRSLMSKGKAMWEDSEGWERLQEMKEEFKN